MILSTNWNGKTCKLVHKACGTEVAEGEQLTDFRGDSVTCTGGRAPHKPSSTGFVFTDQLCWQVYPSAYGLEWVEV